MNLLLDTHALLWWAHFPARLSELARSGIADGENVIFASAVSAYEISLKHSRGDFEFATSLADRFEAELADFGFLSLPVTGDHAQRAGNLPAEHKDPWDRMLAAQAQIEGMQLVSCDRKMAGLGINTYW